MQLHPYDGLSITRAVGAFILRGRTFFEDGEVKIVPGEDDIASGMDGQSCLGANPGRWAMIAQKQ